MRSLKNAKYAQTKTTKTNSKLKGLAFLQFALLMISMPSAMAVTPPPTPTVTSVTADGASSLSCTPSDCEDKKVVITGTNFDSSFTVLGFAAGSIKSCSRDNGTSQITCTLAKLLANSSNNIKVKNVSTNKTAATGVTFPITVLTTPTITSISPASIADCANIDVQISVSNLDPSPTSYDFETSLPVTGCTYAGSGKLNCKSIRSSLTANKSLSAIVLKETFTNSPANKVFSSSKYTTPFVVSAVPAEICSNNVTPNTTVTGAAGALPATSATTSLEAGASPITVTGVTASVPSCGGNPKVTISGSGFNLSSFELGSTSTPSSKDNIAVKALNGTSNIFSSCSRITDNSIDCYLNKNSLPATKKGLTVQLGKKITKTVKNTSSLVSLASQTAKFDYYALSNDACASLPLNYPYIFNVSPLSCLPSECENKSIVITGKNLNTDAQVLGFATGIIKSCTRNSSTQITCITNKFYDSSSNNVSVKNIADNQSTDIINVPINVLTPSVTNAVVDGGAFCNASNSYCDGKNVVITGTNFDSSFSVLGFDTGIVKSCTRNSATQITCLYKYTKRRLYTKYFCA